jgi:hypothetical protein
VTEDRAVVGSLRSTGLRPTFVHKFEKRGISLPVTLFQSGYGASTIPTGAAAR